MENIEELAREHYSLKRQIDDLKQRLSDVADKISRQAVFPDKKSTASVSAGGVKVKVQRRETYCWNQNKLSTARFALGDEKFLDIFRYEWKADKRKLDGFLANAPEEVRRPVEDALTVKRSFSVSTELEG